MNTMRVRKQLQQHFLGEFSKWSHWLLFIIYLGHYIPTVYVFYYSAIHVLIIPFWPACLVFFSNMHSLNIFQFQWQSFYTGAAPKCRKCTAFNSLLMYASHLWSIHFSFWQGTNQANDRHLITHICPIWIFNWSVQIIHHLSAIECSI